MKTAAPTTISFRIIGMHCASCAINIDFELEDLDGVTQAKTHYAKQKLHVTYEPEKITHLQIISVVSKLGYEARIIE